MAERDDVLSITNNNSKRSTCVYNFDRTLFAKTINFCFLIEDGPGHCKNLLTLTLHASLDFGS